MTIAPGKVKRINAYLCENRKDYAGIQRSIFDI